MRFNKVKTLLIDYGNYTHEFDRVDSVEVTSYGDNGNLKVDLQSNGHMHRSIVLNGKWELEVNDGGREKKVVLKKVS